MNKIERLENIAREIRISTLKTIYFSNSGHPGGSLSGADIITALYFDLMSIDPRNPEMENRDRFILSKGHASALLYACLAKRGYFKEEELSTFREIGGRLQGHPDSRKTPGVDMTTGSLGQGLSVGVGLALASKLSGRGYYVYVLLGDGELNEGQIWEAAMSANKYQLDRLIAIVDRNHLQLDGNTEDVMPLEPLQEKWKTFGWEVLTIDGHNIGEVITAVGNIKSSTGKPSVIIADTVKGKGVSFMENKPEWHGRAPDKGQMEQAMSELGGSI